MTTPSLDTVFSLLASRRRRLVCLHFARADETATEVTDLAERVAAMEAAGEPSDALRAEVEAALRHVHLPKLADADVVDYDHRSGSVRYWRQATLEEYVEHAAAHGPCQ